VVLQSKRSGRSNKNVRLVQFQGGRGPAFDLRGLTVPAAEIHSGGPLKDGIPALTNPRLVDPAAAIYLSDTDRVVGVTLGNEARAYPLKILNHHEIINDSVGEVPVAVTYCPLCDSAVVFDRRTPLGVREFGVSGLLYNSNVLMYDRGGQPESLWSQVKAEGVSGPAAGKKLASVPMELTTWNDWKLRHPQTKVLSDQTGHRRDYRRNPYAGYFATPQLMFPAKPVNNRLPAKTRVLGVWTADGEWRAYPMIGGRIPDAVIRDSLGKYTITIQADARNNMLRVVEADESVQWMYSFWFAWYAMHPSTDVSDKTVK
jgi:hypothetical protein